MYQFLQKSKAAQLFSAFIIIMNVSWASDPHIRVISEGSCDTDDWFEHWNKLHFIYSHRKLIYTGIIFFLKVDVAYFLSSKCSR